MNQFIYCLLTADYSLVGGPDKWEELYSEYIGLRENKSTSYILDLLKEIIHLKTKVFIITQCVEVLASRYSQEVIAELKQTGVRGKFDLTDPAQYSKDLLAAITYSKRYILQYENKEREMAVYQQRHAPDTLQRKEFDTWAVTLGQFMGFRVDLDQITAAEYCHMMNAFDRDMEIKNSVKNNIWAKQE